MTTNCQVTGRRPRSRRLRIGTVRAPFFGLHLARARHLLAALMVIFTIDGRAAPPHGIIAHEWGTFTSVQGSDGVLLDWRPLETSALPNFVYDWKHPGLNRQAKGQQFLSKVVMETLQRMETPVIYFYSDSEQTVDVQVSFPQGSITEWYPQAAQIGPATAPVPPFVATVDRYAHGAGVNPAFSFASFVENHCLTNSGVHWAKVRVLPAKENSELKNALPQDQSGSHYFAARDTEADFVRVASLCPTNASPEVEKFLFYRGVGSFATGLRVTMDSNNTLMMANTGEESLGTLLVLDLENGAGHFDLVNRLAPGEKRSLKITPEQPPLPKQELVRNVGDRMAKALEEAGLYPREALAMVNTWRDSWFAEDGLRVLYVLPRAWTDRTLPLKIQPVPCELVRVMVGRAEVITPAEQRTLADALASASLGSAEAREHAQAQLKKLGRFALPTLRLATQGAKPEIAQTGWNLLQASASAVGQNRPL